MNHRRIIAATAGLLIATAAIAAAAPPPALAGLPVLAHADVAISSSELAFTVCASGNVDDGTGIAGTWLLEIEGARSNGTQIEQTNIFFGESFGPTCYTIPKGGAAAGAFGVSLSFATIGSGGSNAVPDFVAAAGGEGAWSPDTSDSTDSFGT